MKLSIVGAVLVASLGFGAQGAMAKGCLKGAAIGAVGGHVAGRHAVLGAAAGCAIGHHMANKAARAQRPPISTTPQATPAGSRPIRG